MIDFAKFLSDNLTITLAKKQALLLDFCLAKGYQLKTMDDEGKEIDNPEKPTSFFNRYMTNYIKTIVENKRKEDAQIIVSIEEVSI